MGNTIDLWGFPNDAAIFDERGNGAYRVCNIFDSISLASLFGEKIFVHSEIFCLHPYKGWRFFHKIGSMSLADEEIVFLYNLKTIPVNTNKYFD